MNIIDKISGITLDIDTKDEVIDNVIERIKEDIAQGDVTAIDELLRFVPDENLIWFLPEEEWTKYVKS
jgi:hypothetical protein